MKNKRIFILLLFLSFIFTLSSCDIDFSKLFESPKTETKVQDKNSDEDKNVDEGGTELEPGEEPGDNPTLPEEQEIEKTDPNELKIKDYVLNYESDYGYIELGKDEEFGNELQSVYRTVYEQSLVALTSTTDYTVSSISGEQMIKLCKITIDSTTFKSGFNPNHAISAIMEMVYDNPLFYFLRPGCATSYTYIDDESVHLQDFVYLTAYPEYATAESRTVMNNYVLTMIADFTDNNDVSNMNDYNKAKSINKYIMDKISYAYSDSHNTVAETAYWAHNLDGFVNPNHYKGVCECYSRAYQLLSDISNLETLHVTGYTNNNVNNGHAWNYTKIDDNWYGIDVTWNDSTRSSFIPNDDGDFFLLGNSSFNRTNNEHTPNS